MSKPMERRGRRFILLRLGEFSEGAGVELEKIGNS